MTISNVHVNKVLLVTFAICCCAIIHNIFINLLRGHEHVYGHYWPIWEKNKIMQDSNFLLVYYKLNSDIFICCLPNKGMCTTCKNGYHRTCSTYSFWVLKFVKCRKSPNLRLCYSFKYSNYIPSEPRGYYQYP